MRCAFGVICSLAAFLLLCGWMWKIEVSSQVRQTISFSDKVPERRNCTNSSDHLVPVSHVDSPRIFAPLRPLQLEMGPPWVPPLLSVEQVVTGILAAVFCDDVCRSARTVSWTDAASATSETAETTSNRTNASTRCGLHETRHCFATSTAARSAPEIQCFCRPDLLLPTEWISASPDSLPADNRQANRSSIAIVMAGQTRSFASNFMREYWKLFLARFSRSADVVLFAVLSCLTSNPEFKKPFLFEEKTLKRWIEGLDVPWRAHFPGRTKWAESVALVKDPALRFLMAPVNKEGDGGLTNGYRARAIALDLILKFEKETRSRFDHVIFVRPDLVYDLPNDIFTCDDAVFVDNDVFALMPRKLAAWFLTHVATARSVLGAGPPQKYPQQTFRKNFTKVVEESVGWNFTGGGLLMPSMHLAFHGIPVYGRGHELMVDTPTQCTFHGQPPLRSVWFVRDEPNATNPGDPNICCRHVTVCSLLRSYALELGVRNSSVAKLRDSCK